MLRTFKFMGTDDFGNIEEMMKLFDDVYEMKTEYFPEFVMYDKIFIRKYSDEMTDKVMKAKEKRNQRKDGTE